MNSSGPRHVRVVGGDGRARRAFAEALPLGPALMPTVSAHRRSRGPYTAAGAVARALVPEVVTRDPDLVRRHDIELLTVAPELGEIVPNSRETLTSMAIPAERTRFYARLRTQRIADGVTEFLRDAVKGEGPVQLVLVDVESADHSDLEFIGTALRRIDPARITLVICVADDELLADESFAAILALRTECFAVPSSTVPPLPVNPREAAPSTRDLAADYINSDCTSDAPNAVEAYRDLEPAERARMHDARADELESQGEFSWSLGAVPYHRERGSDATGLGAQALYAAVDHCVCNGFYDAAVDLGKRGLQLADPVEQPDRWWTFVIATGLSLSVLSRTREAQELFESARGCSTRPTVHMALAYSIAMLYTRHNDPAERNERQAKAWLNSAIATASLVKDPAERAFLSAFYRNGLALVEVNLGDPQEALRLVNHCIDSLDELLDPEDHRLHRTVLKNNRARVFSMLGRFDEALADYAVVVDADPNHAEHYLERGNILRRLGQPAQALANYSTAIRLSPPFPEIYYNRADLLLAEGDTNGALADLDCVLELDPGCVDAYVNRAGIHLSEDRLDAALDDAHAGLAVEPENAHLRAALGQIMTDRGEHTAALREYDRALAAEPTLLAALAGRACTLAGTGDLAAATVDLDRAIELEPTDPVLRFNRAIVHIEAGRRQQARRDLMRAAELAPDDDDIACALARELEVAEAGRDSVLSQV